MDGGRGEGGGRRRSWEREAVSRWFSIDLVLRIRVEFNDSFRGGGRGGREGVVIGRNVLKKFALKRFSGF